MAAALNTAGRGAGLRMQPGTGSSAPPSRTGGTSFPPGPPPDPEVPLPLVTRSPAVPAPPLPPTPPVVQPLFVPRSLLIVLPSVDLSPAV